MKALTTAHKNAVAGSCCKLEGITKCCFHNHNHVQYKQVTDIGGSKRTQWFGIIQWIVDWDTVHPTLVGSTLHVKVGELTLIVKDLSNFWLSIYIFTGCIDGGSGDWRLHCKYQQARGTYYITATVEQTSMLCQNILKNYYVAFHSTKLLFIGFKHLSTIQFFRKVKIYKKLSWWKN